MDQRSRRLSFHPALGLTLAVWLAISGCAFSPLKDNPLAGGELTVEREREITADISRQIRAEVDFIADPLLLAYVNQIGQDLAGVAEPQPFIYRFSLIRDPELNAFTIGGGHIYIHSGVLAQAGDVSELAGVLAHEIAHVRNRHVARRSEGQGLSTMLTLAALAAVALGGADPELMLIAQGINVSLQLKNSREAEAEADREGFRYLVEAGYDPTGMTRFFQRILVAHPRTGTDLPAYLYSHPAVQERIVAARTRIERTRPPDNLRQRDSQLGKMQARLATLLEPVAGGSGLQVRPTFDRAASDPLLQASREKFEEGDLDLADQLLAEAERDEPGDPRIALARAEVAEAQKDLKAAVRHLDRAFKLDPTVPLVQYRLGLAHSRLGNRTRAAFYLEQAAANFRPNSSSRRRAELELDLLSFPLLTDSHMDGTPSGSGENGFAASEPVIWRGRLSRRFMAVNPELKVSWLGPNGSETQTEVVRMNPLGHVSARLPGDPSAVGSWSVEVFVGDSSVARHDFWIDARKSDAVEGSRVPTRN